MQVANRVPLTIVRGKGSYVWAENEKKYLDFICGIATNLLGHADAGLAKAINKQAKKLVHISNIFYSQPQIELGELLLKSSKLDRVWFCNSGAEANEAAIKLARKWGQINKKGAYEILVAKNGFHGRTIATISAIKKQTTAKTVAILIEPIQGEGGVITPNKDYLNKIRQWCNKNNMLLILDEIQTGRGRTGLAWAHQHNKILPDIMTSAKGLGGGLPIGCIMSTKKVDVFSAGDHGSTFGGNVLTCAGAHYVANKLFNSNMLKTIQSTAKILDNILKDLLHEHDDIVKLRGIGLLRGIEFKSEIAAAVSQECLNNGLLVNAVRPNVLRLMPALNVSSNELKKACAIIAKSIDAIH